MRKCQDEYKLDRVLTYPNAIVRVSRPVITEEERARRMNNLKKETARFMKAVLKEERGLQA